MQEFQIANYFADSFPPLPSSKMGQLSHIPVLPAMRQSLPTPLPLNGICHVHVAHHMTNKISCFHPKVLIQVMMNTRNILISFVKTLRTR